MAFELSPLPYEYDALQPHISKETLEYHHDKHHNTYVVNLNNLVPGTEFEDKTLDEIVMSSSGDIFNNAAQVWNHTFYWNCLAPNNDDYAIGALASAIDVTFGSFDKFKEEFIKTSVRIFGSGWSWLVKKTDGSLAIASTIGAGNPLTSYDIPLLTCDVWEHAYYIDYRNVRLKYIEAFWSLVNWKFVTEQFEGKTVTI
ncbi:superoxide dismutase [Candidatus Pseudomonas adelgestsugas]|uniref:Superoxide dismutase n=1 Tax=Candidatus Pseudomonas adelgestsugas TaxID=1302376 RepID=A0ABX5R980_9PSED|nr:Fe-Mn family superoxide dismutase [Candidatus Pseudomonas adelgestsugas]QAX82209.1 Superoxide dismutase [Fe] [Candidatus Pseudomonas adelgestsugas]